MNMNKKVTEQNDNAVLNAWPTHIVNSVESLEDALRSDLLKKVGPFHIHCTFSDERSTEVELLIAMLGKRKRFDCSIWYNGRVIDLRAI